MATISLILVGLLVVLIAGSVASAARSSAEQLELQMKKLEQQHVQITLALDRILEQQQQLQALLTTGVGKLM